jgi:hypothetical protein
LNSGKSLYDSLMMGIERNKELSGWFIKSFQIFFINNLVIFFLFLNFLECNFLLKCCINLNRYIKIV